MFGFEATVDVPAIIAILGLTSVVKMYFPVDKKYIPLIPLALGFAAGIFKGFLGEGLVDLAWYAAIGSVLWTGLLYAGAASTIWKLKKNLLQKTS